MPKDAPADPDLDAFRAETRGWLEANFPPALRGRGPTMVDSDTGAAPSGDAALWKARMADKGWATPTWPAQFGGGGLSPAEARVLQQEMARAGAYNPMAFGMGITMIGPTILDYGTEAQKARHIPPIVRGEARWCVGYSEPNAGSDLASLQTKCEDAGDHWRINGQKVWTSGAQWSDWCGALVRTDPAAKKHEGISFMLVPMRQAGVETRPIKLISGSSPFCETFLTDARAAKDDMLGQINEGWTVGKRLLQHERASQTGGSPARDAGPRPASLADIARRSIGVDEAGRIADLDLRARLTDHLMQARAHGLTLTRVAAESKGNAGPSNAASVLKGSATFVAQTRSELMLEIMGVQGLGWGGPNAGEGDFTAEETEAVQSWLFGRAMSIYGGSSEVQNNIISKRILGLPDTTQST